MHRNFFSSLYLLLALNVLVKPVWIFGIDRAVQNIVGTEVYGKYFSLLSLCIVFNFLLDTGLTTYYNRQKAAGLQVNGNFFLNTVSVKLLFSLVYAVVVFLAAILSGIDNTSWLILLAFNQFLISFLLFFRTNITALQLFTADAWLSVLDKMIVIIGCSAFIYFPKTFGSITIYYFLIIQTAAVIFSLLISVIIIAGKEKIKQSQPGAFNFYVIKSALPYGLIVLLMSTHSRIDSFLLERLHSNGAFEAGVYAGAYRLLDAANMVGYLAASFLLPYIAKHYGQAVLKPVVQKIAVLLFLFSACVASGGWLFSKDIQHLLYHNNDAYAVKIIAVGLLPLIGYSLVQVYGTVLTATGNIGLFIKISVPFMLLNILLNTILIPQYGAIACCIIAAFTQLAYGIATMLAVNKKIYLN